MGWVKAPESFSLFPCSPHPPASLWLITVNVKGCVRVVQECGCNSANLKGLDAASDEVGDHAHNGFLLRVLRQETWGGPSLFQVLYDGQLSRGNIEAGRGLGVPGSEGRGQQTTFSRWCHHYLGALLN